MKPFRGLFIYAAVGVMFLNWLRDWHLPWPVVAFVVAVAVAGMVGEGEEETKGIR